MASSMQPRLETFAAECAISFVRAADHVSRSAVVSAASDGGESALVGGVPLMTACSAASIEATGSGAPVTASRSSTCPTAPSSAIREALGRHRAQSEKHSVAIERNQRSTRSSSSAIREALGRHRAQSEKHSVVIERNQRSTRSSSSAISAPSKRKCRAIRPCDASARAAPCATCPRRPPPAAASMRTSGGIGACPTRRP